MDFSLEMREQKVKYKERETSCFELEISGKQISNIPEQTKFQ